MDGPKGHDALTEYITLEGTSIGPELPFMSVRGYSVTNINETTSLLVGGTNDYDWGYGYLYFYTPTKATYFFNHQTQKWTQGPDMNCARAGHVSGIVTDAVTNEKYIIVIGSKSKKGCLPDSTEILMDGNWILGRIIHSNSTS